MDGQTLNNLTPEQNPIPIKHGHRFLWLYLTVIVAALAAGGVYAWQQKKVTDLQKTQLPQKQFSNFEDCNYSGGLYATTINGAFNACVGRGDNEVNADNSNTQRATAEVFLQYSAQNLPRVEEHSISTKTPKSNVVHDNTAPADLVAILETKENGGCGKIVRSYFKILATVPGYAKLNYGCDNDNTKNKTSTFIFAMQIGNDWRLLSPTNNIDPSGQPSCLLQDMFKLPSKLAPQCYENTGYGDGDLKSRNYP